MPIPLTANMDVQVGIVLLIITMGWIVGDVVFHVMKDRKNNRTN